MNKRSGIQTKKKVLGAALKVFSSSGYSGSSIREIARTAGISVGGVYLYFRNKEELYLSLIKSMIDDKRRRLNDIITSQGTATEALSAFIRFHVEYTLKHKELIFIHIRDHGFTFGMDIKRQYFRDQINALEKIIRWGVRNGEFRRCNTPTVAKIIMALLRGLVLNIALDDERGITALEMNDVILYGLTKNHLKNAVSNNKKKRGSP